LGIYDKYKNFSNKDLMDPKSNIEIGVTRLVGYLSANNGDIIKALCSHLGVPPTSTTGKNYSADILELASWWNKSYFTRNSKTLTASRLSRYTKILKNAGVANEDIDYLAQKLASGELRLPDIKRLRIEHTGTDFPWVMPIGHTGTNPSGIIPITKISQQSLVPYNGTWVYSGTYNIANGDITPEYSRKSVTESGVYYNYRYTRFLSITPTSIPAMSPAVPEDPATLLDFKSKPLFEDIQKKDFSNRLVGAFPSQLVLLVDGGRWIGVERLGDHLYGGMGINSIDIVESRKDPVDVATVTFSNLYGRLTSAAAYLQQQKLQDTRNDFYSEPIIEGIREVIGGGIEQFFSGKISKDLERRWRQWSRLMMLRPGARLHIRIGYGSDGSQYPVKFNGVISEVPVSDRYCQVVALGDAVELMRPFPESDGHMIYDNAIQTPEDAAMYQNTGKGNLHGKEPRNIIAEMFGPTNEVLAAISKGRWLSDNPYGIVHFGGIDYSVGIGDESGGWYPHYNLGEVGVNIYTSKQDPDNSSTQWQNWLTINGSIAHLQGQTLIGVQVEDASPWKVIDTCRKSIPDFIAAVRPFEFRSTLFFGKNWFPYYYKYKKLLQNPDNKPIETTTATSSNSSNVMSAYKTTTINPPTLKYEDLMESKAFSQFHVICSGHNLIANNIIATDENVITNCQSKYIYGGVLKTQLKDGDIMHADTDIFPEHQKTIINHSGILSGTLHGFEGLGTISEWLTRGAVNTVNTAANTSAAMIVRDSVADMYQGGSMIAGDPYIFPWDYVYLLDTSTLMNGLYQVKEVVNHFSVDAGYITVVSPDCLVTTASGRDPSLWLTLARIGYSYGAYRVWRWELGGMLRTNSIQSIKNGVVKSVVGQSAATKEKLLGSYKKIRDRLITTELEGKINTKMLKFFSTLEKNADYKVIKQYSLDTAAKIKSRVTAFDWGKQVGNLIKKANTNKYTVSVAKKMLSLYEEGKEGKGAVGSILRGYEKSAKGVKAAAKTAKAALEGARAGGTGLKAAELGGLTITGVGIPAALLELTCMVLLSSIGDMIGRWLSSRQCIVVMPLKVNNLELTAGLEGHMGCVVGDPISLSDQWFASIFSSEFGSEQFGLIGYVVPFIADFLLPGADSGWNPSNKEILNNKIFSGIPSIQEDSFSSFIRKLRVRTFNDQKLDVQYDSNDFSSSEVSKLQANYTNRISGVSSGPLPADGQVWYNAAKEYIGTTYVWGGDINNLGKAGGLDCSGFTQAVFNKFGKLIPRTAHEQYNSCTKISKTDLRPGDLVFIQDSGYATHVGIYLGNNTVVHASSSRKRVVIASLSTVGWNAYGRF